ncbi:hypothetical protein HU219_03270 [Staphylococcus sp. SS35]|nr:hypothetical protein [Staphylococcus singaporensis]UMT77631.1 hypothetical protein ML436_10850 [Staphylococcus roterodami]
MKQFLYIALVCGIIAGLGAFLHIPQYPSMTVPRIVAILGIISAVITFKDKQISTSLKFSAVLINVLPLFGTFVATN